MKIAHLFPKYHQNVGDHLVQRGILRLLREHVGEFAYTALSTRRRGPDDTEPRGITLESVGLLNEHDLVVIGGSNLYECANGQWGVEVEAEALQRLSADVLLLGIGGGWSFAFPAFPELSSLAAEQIHALHAKARGSSVRDLMTKRILDAHGMPSAVVTGCPATFLADQPLRPVRGGVVGIPFLPQRMYARRAYSVRRWRSPTHQRRRRLARVFLGLIDEVARRGYEPRVLVHDLADLDLARELLADSFFYSDKPEALLEALGACDVIIGFRLHACIAALGMGVPCIPILLDGRNAAFIETFGLTEHAVPIDPATSSMVLDRLALVMGPGRQRWRPVFAKRDELRGVMDGFLDRVFSTKRQRVQDGG